MRSIRHILFIALVMAITVSAYGQAPKLINYQAVARNASGSIIASTAIGVRLTVHTGSASGTIQYEETQTPTTNAYGMFTLQIGGGTATTGTMSAINWDNGAKYLQVEVDPTGGTSYVDMGTQQLVSVPYSMHAGTADTATTLLGNLTMGGDATGTNNAVTVVKLQGHNVSATAPTTGQILKWDGTKWSPSADSTTAYSAGTGVSLTGTTFSANNTTAMWNANQLQGNGVSTVTPTAGQALKWNGTAWKAATDSTTTYSAGTGLLLTGTTFSMPATGVSGTYGSTTQVPVFTTDAQGRVTAVTNTTIPLTGGTVTNFNTTAPLTGGPVTTTGTIGITQATNSADGYLSSADWNTFNNKGSVSSVGLTAGTGVSIAGTSPITGTGTFTVVNTAPDRIVSVGSGTGISVTGVYPTFTVTNTSPSSGGTVTNVNTTGPLTGGPFTTSGTIGITQATNVSNGYLSATDWNTFNNKGTGTVTSVGLTAGTGVSVTGSPITGTGTFTVVNTAPDQTVTMGSGTGISVTGTYPNFTVANTAPNQVVSLTPGAGIGVTGTYPNFTVTNTASGGTVSSVTAGTGLSGGTITSTGTISMPNVGTASTYGSATQVPVITTDAQGRVTGVTNTTIASSTGTVTTINTAAPLSGGPITSSGTISMTTSGVTAATYGSASTSPAITVDAWGRITGASNTTITGTTPGGAATGDLTGTYPAPTLVTTAVTPGSYGSATQVGTFTVDTKGRLTLAGNTTITGTTPGGTAGGDLTGTYPSPTLATTAVTPGSYGSATQVPTYTVDSKGRLTAAGNTTITGTSPGGAAGGDLTGSYPSPTLTTSGVAAGTYGTATSVPTIVVDTKGRITSASNTAITTGVAGTTNYIPVFTSATAIGNSNMYQNGTRIVVNNGTTTHGLMALKATVDTIALYVNESNAPTIYGAERVDYSGPTDPARVGILSTSIRLISDVNGTGIEGAGNQTGVYGIAEASSTTGGQAIGVQGQSFYDGTYSVGVDGSASNWIGTPANAYGIYGTASGGTLNYAGYFQGNVKIIGSISKTSGTFEIDDPLDPANKYLYHSFVESPDMMNVYNGNITTDASGMATVVLPRYFDTLNKDCRYQLTVMGATFAQAIVFREESGNSFEIKTNQPSVKVSWQVTGIRKDAWANAHRVVAEVEKEAFNKGKYLTPLEQGQPAEKGIGSDFKHRDRRNDPALMSHGTKEAQK